MSNMFFKSILIADVQSHKARFVSFQKGLNVITSRENHVGKSSIIKSLYDSLGAEVHFDTKWNKDTKLSVVTIDIDGVEYKVVRFIKKFAIFKGQKLILFTNSITKQLAPKLAEIFDFSVYLTEKQKSKNVVQAPPAFTFMPYYIDQDKGWNNLYESFERMDQFAKPERAKSLYFHLGLFTKSRIEQQARIDQLRDLVRNLQEQEHRLNITIKSLTDELSNIIPADNEDELEKHMASPKKEIEKLVQEIGLVRNKIQKFSTILRQHESQLDIIKKFQQIQVPEQMEKKAKYVCPKCGYEFDEEIYNLVRRNYNQSNADYIRAQIELIVNNIKDELKTQEERYISLMAKLKEQENAYDESQDAYEAYLRYRGLKETIRKYSTELVQNRIRQSEYEDEIKNIRKELQKIPDKKDIEQTYINYVKQNIIALKAWTQEYEGKIKLLQALNAQGSLLPKIILSQYNALFQTMASLNSSLIRFPFVVDSPREKESSISSSKEILSMISKISYLPQVILATVDYDTFNISSDEKINKIYFNEQFNVLNDNIYLEHKEQIEDLHQLMICDVT